MMFWIGMRVSGVIIIFNRDRQDEKDWIWMRVSTVMTNYIFGHILNW